MRIENAVVETTSTKSAKTRYGEKTTYSFKAGGTWYKTGFVAHKLNDGDTVSFDFSVGTYGNDVNPASIVKGAATKTIVASVPRNSPAPAYSSKGVFPIPPLDGQRAIIRQNALTNAREAYSSMSDGLSIDFNNHDQVEQLADCIIRLARHFEAYTTGDTDLREVEEELKGKAE
jgi:hypothetical protein